MNHNNMIKFYQRRKRSQRLNRLGWLTLAMATITVAAITIYIIS
jgi:cytochrome c oxidase assembly factor CtaG